MKQKELLDVGRPALEGGARAPHPDDCQEGAWGAWDRCFAHEGLPLGDDGRCVEGRAIAKARRYGPRR